MSFLGRIATLTDRIRGKAPGSEETVWPPTPRPAPGPPERVLAVADGPPKVECHIPGADGVVAGGPSFLVIGGRLGKLQYDQISQASSDMIEAGARRVGILVDSSGGDMAGVDGAVKALVELRSFLSDNLFTLGEGMAASSAYALIACAGRGKIFATAGAQIGSIGTRIRLEDSSRAFNEDLKITVHEVTSDQDLKSIGAPGFAITDKALKFEEEQVAAAKDVFHRIVSDAKRVPLADIVRAAGEGGLYQASVALDLGLVDRILDKNSFLALVNGETSPTPSEEDFPMAEPEQPVHPPVTQPAPLPVTQASAEPAALETRVEGSKRQAALEDAARLPIAPKAVQDTALAEKVSNLATMVEGLTKAIATDHEARAKAEIEASIAIANGRVEACVGRSITRAGADLQITAVEATIRSGSSPDGILAAVEALPDIADASDLMAEVTLSAAGQDPQDVTFDLRHFSSPGAKGEASVPPAVRERAVQALSAIATLPGKPGESEGSAQRMREYSRLYAQHGFLEGDRRN